MRTLGRSALALLALALTVALGGCETTAEKSAKLEKTALRAGHTLASAKGLSIARASTLVQVAGVTVLHSSEGNAVAVQLHNLSSKPLAQLPIAITVKSATGATLYQNDAAGLARSLVTVTYLPPHGSSTWVDDQIQSAGVPATASAEVGEPASGSVAPSGSVPSIAVSGGQLFEEASSGTGAQGAVANHSSVGQRELVVYAVARKAGAIVAAARAVLPLLEAGASTRFQVFFIGNPQGAKLEVSAPPTTLR